MNNSKAVISHLKKTAVVAAVLVGSLSIEARMPSERLLAAIRQVETDDGKTSANVYQMRAVCVYDVNRIYGTGFVWNDVFNPETSKRIAKRYIEYWSEVYRSKTGKPVTDEVMARIHNGGPRGWERKCTVKYWRKVRKALGR